MDISQEAISCWGTERRHCFFAFHGISFVQLQWIAVVKKEKVKPWSWLAHSCWSLLRFLYREVARSISSPSGRDASPSHVTPLQFVRFPQEFAGTHLYSWVVRGIVRVKCLAQEHNTVSPGRAWTWTARSGVECTCCASTQGCKVVRLKNNIKKVDL